MNVIFTAITILSVGVLLFVSPDKVLSVLVDGASQGLTFSIKLFAVYAVWLSVLSIWEKGGFTEFCARTLKPLLKLLFPKENDDCYADLAVNLSANMLGMGSAGTIAGISATKKFISNKNRIMLLVINSCSIQLIPTTIIAIRGTYNATADIILPTFLSTLIGAVIGIFLVKIFVKK